MESGGTPRGGEMASAAETGGKEDVWEVAFAETERRIDSYYEEVRPGEVDSPIKPLTQRGLLPIYVIVVVLIALWLIGRFVIMPLYY
jgi:hypothetical protein